MIRIAANAAVLTLTVIAFGFLFAVVFSGIFQ